MQFVRIASGSGIGFSLVLEALYHEILQRLALGHVHGFLWLAPARSRICVAARRADAGRDFGARMMATTFSSVSAVHSRAAASMSATILRASTAGRFFGFPPGLPLKPMGQRRQGVGRSMRSHRCPQSPSLRQKIEERRIETGNRVDMSPPTIDPPVAASVAPVGQECLVVACVVP